MHVLQTAPKVSSVREDIPPEIDDIVAKMLAKLPSHRFESLQLVLERLEAIDLYAPTLLAIRKSSDHPVAHPPVKPSHRVEDDDDLDPTIVLKT